MNKTQFILKHTLELLVHDVEAFRNIVLASGGGKLPKEIKEKQKLILEIQGWMKTVSRQAVL